MYIPIEIQRHILSYIIESPEFMLRNKLRCRAITKNNRRCMRKVDTRDALCCKTHSTIEHILSSSRHRWESE